MDGHETDHFAVDGSGNAISGYNVAGHFLASVLPATGQQGVGRSYSVTNYLYPGGPATGSALYDEAGTLIRQVGTTYGPAGETLAAAGTTQSVGYAYDALYRLTALTDGNGNTTRYSYTPAGQLASVAYPRANAATGYDTTSYNYDAAGYLTSTVDGRGVEADYGYEPGTGALSTVQFPAQSSLNEQYAHDAYGRTTGIADGSGAQAFSYDDGGRATGVQTQYAGLPALAITYGYYPDGSRAGMATPGGGFSYRYDAAGRLASLTNPFNETSGWGYLASGRLAVQTLGNGVQTVYQQDALGRLARLTNQTVGGGGIAPAVLSDFTVPSQGGYDGAGDRLGVTATLPAAPNSFSGQTAYGYDPLGRLTGEQSTRGSGTATTFGLDGGAATGAGDLTGLRGQGHSYNADNQDAANTYDGAGNPTTYGGTSLTFDAQDRMAAFGGLETNGYRADGLRASKATPVGTTYFLYDGADPVCELSGGGAVTAVNTFGGAGLLSRHTAAGSTFYTFDERGDVAQRLDGSGSPLSTDLYDAYGAGTSTATAPDPFGFGGQEGYYTDAETGLILCGHRYYDPAAGRFLNRDPIGYAGGLNLYAYCADNPITSSDPSGFNPQHDGGDSRPWYDRLGDWANNWSHRQKDMDNEAYANSPFGVGVATGLNTFVDLFSGPLKTPQAISNLGTGSGNFAGDPTLENFTGVLNDVVTADSVLLPVIAGAAGGEADAISSSPCFVMGTLIQMADGTTKPIQRIKIGDFVWSRDPATGRTEAKRVTALKAHTAHELVTLVLADAKTLRPVQTLVCTPGHPFNVPERGFVAAGRLSVGTSLVTRAGPPVVVLSVKRERASVPVYNFTVEDDHTYFVGTAQGGVWVHNNCGVGGGSGGSGANSTTGGPNFVATPNGTIVPVPEGADGPFPVNNGKGFQYSGGSGGNGLNGKVSGVRIMDPTQPFGPSPGYPDGYASYFNRSGQTIDPYTGQVIAKIDPMWHISL